MPNNFINDYLHMSIDEKEEVLLFESGEHRIYWLGIEEETAFRCNVYLIQDGDEYLIVDPGSRIYHEELKKRVATIVAPEKITGLIICHQDPDVAASMVDWLAINPELTVFTSARTNVLLPYYGIREYRFFNISQEHTFTFRSGRTLRFIEAPFLHFPGAFTTLDTTAAMLFSGDIWAALDIDWNLVVADFDAHRPNMDLFHLDYMASNVATRGFAEKIEHETIDAILPQHGSILGSAHVKEAIEYLKTLQCGLDIIYSK